MRVRATFLNLILAAVLPVFLTCAAFAEDTGKLDELFTRLLTAEADEAGRIETEIWIEWRKSGSPALDLLLQRGLDAMNLGDFDQAIEHFTAVIDHDPDFVEAWNARATAYFYRGDFGPSLADIGHVLAVNPRHFGALSGLGMFLESTGQPDRALKAYQAALAIDPHLAGAVEAVERLSTDQGQEL